MKKYFIDELKKFLKTVKTLDKKFLYIISIDLAFILLLILSFFIFAHFMNSIIPQNYGLGSKLASTDYMTTFELYQLKADLLAARNKVYIYSSIFVVVMFLIFMFSRQAIYSVLAGKSPVLKDTFKCIKRYLRFTLLNMITNILVFVCYLLFLTLMYLMLKSSIPLKFPLNILVFSIIMYVLMLLYYFILSANVVFTQTESMLVSLKTIFKFILPKIHLALFPTLLIFTLFIIINAFLIIIQGFGELVSVILATLLLVLFMGFIKTYYRKFLITLPFSQGFKSFLRGCGRVGKSDKGGKRSKTRKPSKRGKSSKGKTDKRGKSSDSRKSSKRSKSSKSDKSGKRSKTGKK